MRPLEGVRVVVTRAVHQAEELAGPLRDLGAKVILAPVIGIAPPADATPLHDAARRADDYDWIIFTSANAVEAFATLLSAPPAGCQARIAVIGAATRESAEQHGFSVALIPERYVAESLVETFAATDLNERRILIPSAAVTRDLIPDELRKRGAHVDVVEAYRNVLPPEAAEHAVAVFREPYPHWVTFASSSAVGNLVQLVGVAQVSPVKIATIGPVTSETVRKHGLEVAVEAEIHSIEGLVRAIRKR
ncbi:MAG TPA: uroporphyrinogen-III synthase [Bryobacteraceae bacterium]